MCINHFMIHSKFKRMETLCYMLKCIMQFKKWKATKNGVNLDNRLDWGFNTEAVYRKGQSRFYFLSKLRSFISRLLPVQFSV